MQGILMPDDTQPTQPNMSPDPTPTPLPGQTPVPTPDPSPASFTPPAPSEPTPFSPAPAQPGLSDPTPSPFGPVPPAQNTAFGSQVNDQPTGTPTPDLIPQAPKSKKKLVIIIAGIVALLIIGAVAAYLLLQPNRSFGSVDNTGGDSAADIAPSEKEAITAANIGEFREVCNGKKISNAPDVSTPVKTVPFIDMTGEWTIFLYSLAENDRLTTKTDEAAVVACAQPDESTATAAKACQPTDFGTKETYDVEYKGVTFDLTFYAAKTGEVIETKQITSTNDTCPLYATEAGTTYAMPSEAVATAAFNEFFAEN